MPPTLLSGGNPQIAKGDGDAPAAADIAAMPGGKRPVGERLDALVAAAVPDVRRAVRWNSPFYRVEGGGWFLSFHCFTRYVKVTFFDGACLDPMPPVAAKDPKARLLHIGEADAIDADQLSRWLRQAAGLPGWTP
ncbi:MAG: DUF1801 domain-containing protein [Amaricoccus sp.]|uniref:DUF1801 domain-containing protein n=1 Tax=Amaricoccus sp. TaxID=1872485 RepID=UPI0039E404CF